MAHLLDSGSEAAAEATKLKIEKVYLDQICRKIYQCTDNGELCYVLALNDELFTKQVLFLLEFWFGSFLISKCLFPMPPTPPASFT